MRRALLLIGDIVILYLSLLLTLLVRYGSGSEYYRNLNIHFLPFTFLFGLWVIIFYMANLYDISFTKNNLRLFTVFLYATIVNASISIAFFYTIPFLKITPKTNFLIFLTIELVLATPWRYFFNKIITASGSKNNTLILGLSEQAQEMYDFMLANPQLGYHALGIVDVEHSTAAEVLENLVRQKNVKTLILAPVAYRAPRIIDILYRLVGPGMTFHNLADFFEPMTGRISLGTIDQTWFIKNLSGGNKRIYETIKRIADITLALIISIITLPFYPFIILAIKLDSEGPVFYRQVRVGQAGKPFILIKFRNMIKEAESTTGAVWASEDDSRVTRVGRFLRRTRIDELPQIWNILKGEMSFIGPRPERPEFREKLKKEIPFYEERYLIRPGLTGWAQTKFKLDFRGGMTLKDTYEKLQYDLYYIKNRSLVLDGAVVLKTINIILKKLFR